MANFYSLMIRSRNPKERAYHFTNQEAGAQRGYVLCPRSPNQQQDLDLNTGVNFRDAEIDQSLSCLLA